MSKDSIKPNLADPDFEPTEEQLDEVMRSMIKVANEKSAIIKENLHKYSSAGSTMNFPITPE